MPGLQAHAQYQFSVLAQNKLGSGPFSEIVLSTPDGKRSPQLCAVQKRMRKCRMHGLGGEGQGGWEDLGDGAEMLSSLGSR